VRLPPPPYIHLLRGLQDAAAADEAAGAAWICAGVDETSFPSGLGGASVRAPGIHEGATGGGLHLAWRLVVAADAVEGKESWKSIERHFDEFSTSVDWAAGVSQ
jgi:hypothetical protein